VHAPNKDISVDTNDSLYKELERVFDQFLKNHMIILLEDFNTKVGREDIFKPTIGNDSLRGISKINGFRVVKFVTSKNPIIRSTMFPHCNILKYT